MAASAAKGRPNLDPTEQHCFQVPSRIWPFYEQRHKAAGFPSPNAMAVHVLETYAEVAWDLPEQSRIKPGLAKFPAEEMGFTVMHARILEFLWLGWPPTPFPVTAKQIAAFDKVREKYRRYLGGLLSNWSWWTVHLWDELVRYGFDIRLFGPGFYYDLRLDGSDRKLLEDAIDQTRLALIMFHKGANHAPANQTPAKIPPWPDFLKNDVPHLWNPNGQVLSPTSMMNTASWPGINQVERHPCYWPFSEPMVFQVGPSIH